MFMLQVKTDFVNIPTELSVLGYRKKKYDRAVKISNRIMFFNIFFLFVQKWVLFYEIVVVCKIVKYNWYLDNFILWFSQSVYPIVNFIFFYLL